MVGAAPKGGFQPLGVIGGLEAGGWKAVGIGIGIGWHPSWKAVGRWVGSVQNELEGGLEGTGKVRNSRRLLGGPYVSTKTKPSAISSDIASIKWRFGTPSILAARSNCFGANEGEGLGETRSPRSKVFPSNVRKTFLALSIAGVGSYAGIAE